MLKPFAVLQQFLKPSLPQPHSQEQLISLLFDQCQCPHCDAKDTLTVIPGSEAGAFDFDLACSDCGTEYEVRPTSQWSKHPQEVKMYPICNQPAPQPVFAPSETIETQQLHAEPAV